MVRSRPRKGRLRHLTKVRCIRPPFSVLSLRFLRGAGYTFGSGVVYKFLDQNNMSHILRAHQLCMEGYASLFDKHLSTVWSAPNYCYRCGNSASILEVGPGSSMYFNVFDAAPENERDGPTQQAAQNASGKVCYTKFVCKSIMLHHFCSFQNISYELTNEIDPWSAVIVVTCASRNLCQG